MFDFAAEARVWRVSNRSVPHLEHLPFVAIPWPTGLAHPGYGDFSRQLLKMVHFRVFLA
jgi:hypothetical protein